MPGWQPTNKQEVNQKIKITGNRFAIDLFNQPETVESLIGGIVNQPEARNQAQSQIATWQFLETSIRSLLVNGKQVFVMEDVPEFVIDPLMNYRTSRIPIRHAIAMGMGVLDDSDEGVIAAEHSSRDALATAQLREVISALSGATLVDLRHEFCSEASRCIYRKDEVLFYLDFQHLSPAGADYALRDFRIPPANP